MKHLFLITFIFLYCFSSSGQTIMESETKYNSSLPDGTYPAYTENCQMKDSMGHDSNIVFQNTNDLIHASEDSIILPLLEPKDSVIYDIIETSLAICNEDSIKGDCFFLSINYRDYLIENKNRGQEDKELITQQYLECTAFLGFFANLYQPNDYFGYCIINGYKVIVEGTESYLLFQPKPNGRIQIKIGNFPDFYDYNYPNFFMIQGTPYLDITTTNLRKIYRNAVSLVLDDNQKRRDQVEIVKDLLPYDSFCIDHEELSPIKMLSCQQRAHALNFFIVNDHLFDNGTGDFDSKLTISEVADGFFIIVYEDSITKTKETYYFQIELNLSSVILLKKCSSNP